jgi:hypothetical protein
VTCLISADRDFLIENGAVANLKIKNYEKVRFLYHSNIFSNFGVCTETISLKIKFIKKIEQTLVDKNPIFILDCNQIANSNVLVLKIKTKSKCFFVCLFLQFQGFFYFQISHAYNFNRKWSIG